MSPKAACDGQNVQTRPRAPLSYAENGSSFGTEQAPMLQLTPLVVQRRLAWLGGRGSAVPKVTHSISRFAVVDNPVQWLSTKLDFSHD